MVNRIYMLFTLKKFYLLQSTNNLAKEILTHQGFAGLIIVADQQSNGRGTRGRNWHSPSGNLYFSLITEPIPIAKSGQLAYLSALSVGHSIWTINPQLPIKYKWPNDILLDGLKLAGILIEREPNGVVVGIGLNLKEAPGNTFANYLDNYLIIDRDIILSKILLNFARFWKIWQREGFAPIRSLWCKNAWKLGKKILTSQGEKGIFQGIDMNGFLQLRNNNGEVKLIHQI